uniref:Uncharacterized protein n=1 Tax=Anopheles quadriannulatus TaxID=34691 RepID=A0A182XR53_ANOQN
MIYIKPIENIKIILNIHFKMLQYKAAIKKRNGLG